MSTIHDCALRVPDTRTASTCDGAPAIVNTSRNDDLPAKICRLEKECAELFRHASDQEQYKRECLGSLADRDAEISAIHSLLDEAEIDRVGDFRGDYLRPLSAIERVDALRNGRDHCEDQWHACEEENRSLKAKRDELEASRDAFKHSYEVTCKIAEDLRVRNNELARTTRTLELARTDLLAFIAKLTKRLRKKGRR